MHITILLITWLKMILVMAKTACSIKIGFIESDLKKKYTKWYDWKQTKWNYENGCALWLANQVIKELWDHLFSQVISWIIFFCRSDCNTTSNYLKHNENNNTSFWVEAQLAQQVYNGEWHEDLLAPDIPKLLLAGQERA